MGVSIIVLIFLLFMPSCKWVNPTAPSEAKLFVSANPTTVPTGGSTSTITVIGYNASGGLLKNRTLIHFTTDIGSIDPMAEIRDSRAVAVFRSDSRSGTAHIYVSSGKATVTPSPLEIMVGSSALSALTIAANPSVLGSGGGRARILANAFDKNGNRLEGIPVVFSTDAGALDSGGTAVYTDHNGTAEDELTTTKDANVKAVSGNLSATVKVTVTSNTHPTASFVFSPSSPKVNDTVYFNGSASTDSDGTIAGYSWDFGNGSTGTGVQTSCRYSAARSYQVTLVVRDNSGDTGASSQVVTVAEDNNSSPVAKFVFSPTAPDVDEVVYFNASASTDSDGTIVGYSWDFGDGSSGEGIQPTHQYSSPGTYQVTLVVEDDRGATGAASLSVPVTASGSVAAEHPVSHGP